MPAKNKPEPIYQSRGCVTKLTFTSRVSMKVKDNFYTVEAQIEKQFPLEIMDGFEGTARTYYQDPKIDIEKEKKILWDEVNAEVDNQAKDILDTFK